jgi:hypothetical protein
MDSFTDNNQSDDTNDEADLSSLKQDDVAAVSPETSPQPVGFYTNRRFVLEMIIIAFALGLGSGLLLSRFFAGSFGENQATTVPVTPTVEAEELAASVVEITLPNQYTLPVSYGNLGPQLLAVGAVDIDRFVQVYEEAGQPLTEEQVNILKNGSDTPITINRENAYFLLNFFWAVGLTNDNPLLKAGAMVERSEGKIETYASTGGWTLATKPIAELYASTPIIPLTAEQQARLEEVANAVYRPCCNNPTSFPDCNHGMAMLGVLQLMSAQDATTEEMFTAAKYLNAFWFPKQTTELALAFKVSNNQSFAEIDARELVGAGIFSSAGYREVHQWLADNNLLPQTGSGGNSCGV